METHLIITKSSFHQRVIISSKSFRGSQVSVTISPPFEYFRISLGSMILCKIFWIFLMKSSSSINLPLCTHFYAQFHRALSSLEISQSDIFHFKRSFSSEVLPLFASPNPNQNTFISKILMSCNLQDSHNLQYITNFKLLLGWMDKPRLNLFLLALGWYAFIETSSPRRPNDTARLISTNQVTRRGQCLNFWYHMYGPHVNQLSVYLKKGNTLGRPVWSKFGTHGDVWKPAHVLMNGSPPYKVYSLLRSLDFLLLSEWFSPVA